MPGSQEAAVLNEVRCFLPLTCLCLVRRWTDDRPVGKTAAQRAADDLSLIVETRGFFVRRYWLSRSCYLETPMLFLFGYDQFLIRVRIYNPNRNYIGVSK